MKHFLISTLASLLAISAPAQGPQQQSLPLIPYPQQAERLPGVFALDRCTRLRMPDAPELADALRPLEKALAGIALRSMPCAHSRYIAVQIDPGLGAEAYRLEISPKLVKITGGDAAGVFYAVQTLLQLLPEQAGAATMKKREGLSIPCVRIEDKPAFAYRGLMLDVARHFMPLDSIKRILDGMAMQKMNRFHWHLTDSQGWRFESKRFPNLITTGAYRKGTPLNTTYDYDSRPQDTLYGGYYTQEQMRALVRYAQERFITIVPEIEMPAHSRSALASYPQLACSDSLGVLLPNAAAIPDDSYCTKDEVFEFLEGILEEVMDVFPGPLIHIGGDEAPHQNWKTCAHCRQRIREEGLRNEAELQSYFIRRIERFVNGKGRAIIGWDEILDGGLAPNARVMSWRGTEGGIAAARAGHYAVMTPGSHCYFDHYQSDDADEPPAWGGLTTLEKVYGYEPVPEGLDSVQARFILGAQGNLWTEFVPTYRQAAYMLFPRATALAEVLWTHNPDRQFGEFLDRLEIFSRRLRATGIPDSPHRHALRLRTEAGSDGTLQIQVSGVANADPIYYTTDGTLPTRQSHLYTGPVAVSGNTLFKAAVPDPAGGVRDKIVRQLFVHAGIRAALELTTPPSRYYNKGGNGALIDGLLGSNGNFADDQWLGWSNGRFEAVLDLGAAKRLERFSTRFFHKPQSWIWAPAQVEVLASADGREFRALCSGAPAIDRPEGPVDFSGAFPAVEVRYLRIVIRALEQIPPGQNGAGNIPWIFIDELILE